MAFRFRKEGILMERHELSDLQWEVLEPCLPPLNTGRGRKMHDRRRTINGTSVFRTNNILWCLKTGVPWRDIPQRYGKWGSLYARYRLWQQDGTWDTILEKLLIRFHADGKINWSLFSVDGTIVKAHKSSAGALTKKSRRRTARPRNRQVERRPHDQVHSGV